VTSSDPVGILPVDKAVGGTSHDVVARARRGLGMRRVGHTGTLDPFASGLLLLCLGPATRLAEYFHPLPKRYRAVMRLGARTDTDDRTGEPVGTPADPTGMDEARIRDALAAQVGEIEQVPPQFSAKKVGGERSYRAARAGREVEVRPVRVRIHSIEVERISLPDVSFSVSCSTGTYIRAIARDVGEALGVGGHLTELRRTAIGDLRVEDALPEGDLDDRDAARAAVIDPARALSFLPARKLSESEAHRVGAGNRIAADEAPGDAPVLLLRPDGSLLAVAERTGEELQPRKVIG
jgi:tRNA pseudouridine55 synthase